MQAAGLAVILVLAVVAALAIFHNTGGSPGAAVVVFALVLLVGLFAGYLRYPAGRWRYTVMVGPAGMKIWDRFERRLEQYDWSRIGKVSGGCFRGLILRFGHEQVIFDTGNWASIEDCARRINAYRRRLENAGLIEP